MKKNTKPAVKKLHGTKKKSNVRSSHSKEELATLELFKQKSIVKIDLGCGENKIPETIGVDFRKMNGVDVVQDLSLFPWKNIPSESVDVAYSSHLLEHLEPGSNNPQLAELIELLISKGVLSKEEVHNTIGEYRYLSGFVRFMDEVWRILKPGGQFISVFPYGGSEGFIQDPSHRNMINHTTFAYFDPLAETPDGQQYHLYNIYRPKPWKIVKCYYNQHGFIEVALERRLVDKSYNTLDDTLEDKSL